MSERGAIPAWPGEADLAAAAAHLASRLPPSLEPLARLAFNYRWSWLRGGPELFAGIDPERWEACRHNPVRLLLEAEAPALARAAADRERLRRARALLRAVEKERAAQPRGPAGAGPVAFLCAEFGVHPSLPAYAGGLGVLAGDVLKEASDLALPVVGVGILYRQGTFHQRVDQAGWQHEHWAELDPALLPAAPVRSPDGSPIEVRVPLRGREVVVGVWRVDVGRVPLYLLDAWRPENAATDRWITSRLYVGDRRIRLAQYAVLGIGGVRALRALGIRPALLHLNEGHAALAPLELVREGVEAGEPVEEALARARARTVFTTHTPVPAGNEAYALAEVREVLGELPPLLEGEGGLIPGLGRSRPEDPEEPVGMTVLGIRASRSTNAVSRIHRGVARAMWAPLYPGKGAEEVPISHVTNGVHIPTWMDPAMRQLLDRYLGEGWQRRADLPSTWDPVEAIPDRELWEVRCRLRRELVEYLRARTVEDRLARGESPQEAEEAARALDPDLPVLGFARRVAAYKRLALLARDPDRMAELLAGPHPFQLVLGGKAHPEDEEAKRLLQEVLQAKWAQPPSRVVFLEDYDLAVAARLVAGSDVWLNLPRPPLEASGTSGMKAALNGGLNLSVLDGWWAEGFDGQNGWAIEADPSLSLEEQDERDAARLLDLLDREVLPAFADRDEEGLPRRWVDRIKRSLRTIGPRFCATRMLRDYLAAVYAAG